VSIGEGFSAAVGGHPIVAEILWRRGIRTIDAARAFLDPNCYTPAPPEQLTGMQDAVARLGVAINKHERILVWGDFDVDGQTSTSLLVQGLREAGAEVSFTIPNRAHNSHGLNIAGIARAREDGVRLLLTCDCGVTDFAEVAYARDIGLDVIISDHHDLGDRLPEGCVVLNPKRLPPDHRFANLPGVGVAYLLMKALFAALGKGDTVPEALLDLVALGIVADVADQTSDTRYLLQRGLAKLRVTPRPGLGALLEMARVAPSAVNAETISFQIGPRLNAVGRLDDAALSVELLTTTDERRAKELAAKVEALNQDRRVIQRRVEEEAFRMVAQNDYAERSPVIVLSSTEWSASVLGVVASTLTNRYDKPAILISVKPGEVGRASARSVRGIDIHAAITSQAHLIETSGGHPMAAGFAIHYDKVAAFREGVSQYIAAHPQVEVVTSGEADASPNWHDVTLRLADELERLAPFGAGNPRPLLKSTGLKVVRMEDIGRDRRHQAVFLQDDTGYLQRAVWWRSGGQSLPERCDLVFTVQPELYKGKRRLQVKVERFETEGAIPAATTLTGERYKIIDLRTAPDVVAEVARLRAEYGTSNAQVWEEGLAKRIDGSLTRVQLAAGSILVIANAPPGHDEMTAVLTRVSPQTVALLSASTSPGQDHIANVLNLITAMLRHGEKTGDSAGDPEIVIRMAARIGQRVETVRAAIACLSGADERAKLEYLLAETAAYRNYYDTASARSVLELGRETTR
jgi:single-stranded-DNA-specific exonuclease